MKVHSLKLTIQDMPDKEGNLFAAVFGTLVMDTGEIAVTEKGDAKLDEEGNQIPLLEDTNFVFPLDKEPQFKSQIQAMLVETLTLKNWEIAEENGQLSHFVRAVGANPDDSQSDAIGGDADKTPTNDENKESDSASEATEEGA